MKEYWQKIKEWWNNLSMREKQALMGGGVLLVVFLIYQIIWSPFMNNISSMRLKIERDQKTLVFMQGVDNEIQKLDSRSPKQKKSISPVALLGLLQKQIDKIGLSPSLTQLKQGTNESVEMHFQKVSFDKLMKLLIVVVKDQNVTISQMSTNTEEGEGMVNADVVLKL